MSTQDRIAALKQLTADLEAVAKAEKRLETAKDAYRDDKSEKNKSAYRKASQELSDLRVKLRSDNEVRDVAPGGVSLTPATVGSGSTQVQE